MTICRHRADDPEIAAALATVMRDRRISNRALAKQAGISHPTIGFVLNVDHQADLGTLARLEVALGTDLYPAGLHRHLPHN